MASYLAAAGRGPVLAADHWRGELARLATRFDVAEACALTFVVPSRVTVNALSRQSISAALRRRGFARSVAQTGGFNFATMALAGLGGIVIARAVGPTVCGEYAAVTAWVSVSRTAGGMGQGAALVYYAAREPLRAREYVATSRAMMMATGMVTVVAGFLLAPALAHRLPAVTVGYRIAFGSSIVVFVGGSLIASLQARDHPPVERGTGDPAGIQPDRDRRALAAAAAHVGCRTDRARRDRAAAARVGLRLLSAHGPGTRARPRCPGPAAVGIRCRAGSG